MSEQKPYYPRNVRDEGAPHAVLHVFSILYRRLRNFGA